MSEVDFHNSVYAFRSELEGQGFNPVWIQWSLLPYEAWVQAWPGDGHKAKAWKIEGKEKIPVKYLPMTHKGKL